MKIRYYSACTSTDIEIDGKSYYDYTEDERKEIAHKILDEAFSGYFDLCSLLKLLLCIPPDKDYFDTESCECCGHNYEKAEWEINENESDM